jgi:sulfate adenylyltransferase
MFDQEKTAELISPYGGALVSLGAPDEERSELLEKAKFLPSVQISLRSLCDLELLAVGAFSPLDRFMGEKDYKNVLKNMRLADGSLFPIPITLPVEHTQNLERGKDIVLRGPTNEMLAIMHLEEAYPWDLKTEALSVLGTTDSRHALVAEMHTWGRFYLSGPLTLLNLPKHYDFPPLRRTPAEIRSILENKGYKNVVSFQPRYLMHRAHEELIKRTMEELKSALLIHPIVGMTDHRDTDDYTRVRCYKTLVDHYFDPGKTLLSLLPLATRMAGPRAGLWHGIINRNYGVNHMIMGKDRLGQERNSQTRYFYDSNEVQRLFRLHEKEIGVRMIPLKEMVYMPDEDAYEEYDKAAGGGKKYISISGPRVREDHMSNDGMFSAWFTRPEVARIFHKVYPPKAEQGFCVWLTGLPSSGKSTIADILAPSLMAKGKKASLLDGDVVRTHLSKGLGFTKEDRITNILRIGFVASEIVKHDGIVICALISPYASARDKVRAMIGEEKFIEVFVDTPIGVCAERDVKGMFARAKKGEFKGLTGVDDDYEPPLSPEIRINTVEIPPEECAEKILEFLVEKGFVAEQTPAELRKTTMYTQQQNN